MATFLPHNSIDDWVTKVQTFAAARPQRLHTPEPTPPEVPPTPTPVEIPPVRDPPVGSPPAPVRDPPASPPGGWINPMTIASPRASRDARSAAW
jgi:hypothetical protein